MSLFGSDKLKGKRVAILATDGFEQVEMTCPKKVLNQNGAVTHIISPNKSFVRGWNHLDWGERYKVDVSLQLARPEYYDALLIPGGVLGLDALRIEHHVVNVDRVVLGLLGGH